MESLKRHTFEAIEREIDRTYDRVDRGEFASMRNNSLAMRATILMEELGEIAELAKIMAGKKPKHPLSHGPVELVEVALHKELIQLAAITVDWITCED